MAGTGGDGRGDRLYIAGVDCSGDASTITNLAGGWETADTTPIDNNATTRIGTMTRGELSFTAWFNPTRAHPTLSALPTTDVIATYIHGTNPTDRTAGLVAKQADYPATRGADGSITLPISLKTTGSTVEWGRGYVAGLTRTDTTATSGAGVDDITATASGLSAYVHVTAFTGATATINVQHSDDNGVTDAWATILTFSPVTTAPTAQRATTNTNPIKQWLRVVTAGTFSSFTFHAMASRLGGLILGSTVAVDVQTFDANGTWTKPSGVTAVFVAAIGAGGGGGSGAAFNNTNCSGGAGGGGGAYTSNMFPASSLGATETVTIGTGGAGGVGRATAPASGASGGMGGNTVFGTVSKLVAQGGGQGGGGISGFASAGGQGGAGGSNGSAGGNGGSATPGDNGVQSKTVAGAGGGAGGGGSSVQADQTGSTGGLCLQLNLTGAGAAGDIGTAGGAAVGAPAGVPVGGQGGGGGGSESSGLGSGAGGKGGAPGGGGGGSGSADLGFGGPGSRVGGAGANGRVVIVSW